MTKSLYINGNRTFIKFGDSEIEYDSNFKLYMTSKLENPKFLPEVFVNVNNL